MGSQVDKVGHHVDVGMSAVDVDEIADKVRVGSTPARDALCTVALEDA